MKNETGDCLRNYLFITNIKLFTRLKLPEPVRLFLYFLNVNDKFAHCAGLTINRL